MLEMCVSEVSVFFVVVVIVVFFKGITVGGKHKDFTIQVGGESSFHYLTDKVTLTFC